MLKQRKLVLLVDLDQTLIHTSNRPPKPQEAASVILFGFKFKVIKRRIFFEELVFIGDSDSITKHSLLHKNSSDCA